MTESGESGRQAGVLACCAGLYGHPLAELLVGESFHPGGLASTRGLLRAAGFASGARVLDAGCGLGASARLAAAECGLIVDATDGSATAIARAAERDLAGRVRWARAELSALPYEDGRFDGVLAECVLSTTERTAVLPELARVMRPGAILAMTDVEVAQAGIPSLLDHSILGAALCVTDAWRPDEIASVLPAAGFLVRRRWDLTPSILELVDRAEARAGLAAIAIRDLGLDIAVLASADGNALAGAPLDSVAARTAAAEIRLAVRRGDLRYFGMLATKA